MAIFFKKPKFLISDDVESQLCLLCYSMENTDDDELWDSKVVVSCVRSFHLSVENKLRL